MLAKSQTYKAFIVRPSGVKVILLFPSMMGGVVVRAFVCAGFIISHIGAGMNQGRLGLCCFGALAGLILALLLRACLSYSGLLFLMGDTWGF